MIITIIIIIITIIIIIINDFEKHKHVEWNDMIFRRFGDVMTPLGTLSKDEDDVSENVAKKNEFAFFQT